MPTGYTAKLMEKGQTFEEFAMLCARNFGACIMLRDEPMDAPIPENFEPSDFNLKSLAKAQSELLRLQQMDESQRRDFGNAARSAKMQRMQEWLEKEQAENVRIDEMLDEVKKWKPPTANHHGIKKFMVEQLEMSRNNTDYIEKERRKAELTMWGEYYDAAVKEQERSIEWSTKEAAAEISRTDGRNEWIKQLRDSLKTK